MRTISLFFLLSWLLAAQEIGVGFVPGRYIVELADPPVMEAVKSKSRATATADVKARQESMAQAIAARGGIVKAAVQNAANALVVETNELGAAAILTLPGVRSVEPVRMFRANLDRAVIRSSAPAVWNMAGGQSEAGRGVKIAIIDSGVQASHPAFQGGSFATPAGFPRLTNESDRRFATDKVIVVRSYVDSFTGAESGLDGVGHGTMVAAAAAATVHTAPVGTMSGMAPGAQIGSYKTSDASGGSSSDAILRALDDAAADGMDVVNMSLSPLTTPPFLTILDRTIERLDRAGIVVVEAGGNSGPDLNSVGALGTTSSLVVAGAVPNDRRFQVGVVFPNGEGLLGFNGNGPLPAQPATGVLADAAALPGNNELGCNAFPADSLTDRVVLILRGVCNFSVKLTNAQRAGARAALIYTDAERPDASNFIMDVQDSLFPALLLNYGDGVRLKQRIADSGPIPVVVNFRPAPVAVPDPNFVSDFSGRGPQVDFSIKPDLVAVGGNVFLPTQTNDPSGLLYAQSGYRSTNGTSFSSPIIAGAAALIKAMRPGLTGPQYRSLLINSAVPIERDGRPLPPQEQGAGLLNVEKAVRSTIAVAPTQAALGLSQGTVDVTRELTFSNLGNEPDTLTFRFVTSRGDAAPEMSAPSLTIDPRASGTARLNWRASGLAPGPYQGYLMARSERTGLDTVVPYWLGVADGVPAVITWLTDTTQARRNSMISFTVKVLDKAAVPTDRETPTVRPELADGFQEGSVISITPDQFVAGQYTVRIRLSFNAGVNLFRIRAGEASQLVGFIGN